MAFDFASIREGFFDTERIQRSVSAGARRVLSKFGAFIRTRARSSIRKRKAVSQPGKPPSEHTGIIRLIFFAWDAATESMVAGPIKAAGKDGRAPTALERGGEAVIAGNARRKSKRVTIRPRPFMGPALDHEQPKFAAQLRNLMQ